MKMGRFLLFETTDFFFGGGLPKWKVSTGKKHFTPAGKIGKSYFAPSEKYSSYATARYACVKKIVHSSQKGAKEILAYTIICPVYEAPISSPSNQREFG